MKGSRIARHPLVFRPSRAEPGARVGGNQGRFAPRVSARWPRAILDSRQPGRRCELRPGRGNSAQPNQETSMRGVKHDVTASWKQRRGSKFIATDPVRHLRRPWLARQNRGRALFSCLGGGVHRKFDATKKNAKYAKNRKKPQSVGMGSAGIFIAILNPIADIMSDRAVPANTGYRTTCPENSRLRPICGSLRFLRYRSCCPQHHRDSLSLMRRRKTQNTQKFPRR